MRKVVLIIFYYLLTACATSPTGRMQFIYMSDAEMGQMGVQAFTDLKTKKSVSKNSKHIEFVNCIAKAITDESGGEWEVVVFEDNSLNAFALPGNKIGVHEGLINLVDNQGQLAAVIGHEVGHVQARHGNERISQKTAVNEGVATVQTIANPTSTLGQLGVSALGVGAQYGIILPFSRTHESEADIIGLELMAKAGFDPKESVVLWQKMAQAAQGQESAEFMSTHPSNATRIKDLSDYLPKVTEVYQVAQESNKSPRCFK